MFYPPKHANREQQETAHEIGACFGRARPVADEELAKLGPAGYTRCDHTSWPLRVVRTMAGTAGATVTECARPGSAK